MLDHTTELYCIIDDLLKARGHQEAARRNLSAAEVLTTALVAAQFFSANLEHARRFMQETGLIPQRLSRSRLNRRRQNVMGLRLPHLGRRTLSVEMIAGVATTSN